MPRYPQAVGGPADGAYLTDPGGVYVYLDNEGRKFASPGPDRGLYVRGSSALNYAGPAAWACECGAILTRGPECPLCGQERRVTA